MTIEYRDPSARELKEKEEVPTRVSSKRSRIQAPKEEEHIGSYYCGPVLENRPFANLKLSRR